MIYDIEARKRLAGFVERMGLIIDYNRTFSQGTEDRKTTELQRITKETRTLFESYQAEDSAQARFEYLNEVLQSLKKIKTEIISGKTWWQKFIGFFGFMSPAEREAQREMSRIESAHAQALADYDNIHYPHWTFRVARFFGVHSIKQFLANKYDAYDDASKLTYLSHHLMGKRDLNHHTVLQGKLSSSAYRDFVIDLKEFIEQNNGWLDKQTSELLKTVLGKVDKSTELANEQDKASAISRLKLVSPTVIDGLISDLTYQTQKAMIELRPGASLIIPGGYKDPTGGHATVIECRREDESQFVFRVINTGAGSNETESWRTFIIDTVLLGSRTRPIKVTSPLTLDKISNIKLIEKIIRPSVVVSEESARAMNEAFLKLNSDNKLHDDKQRLVLQTNGTCSHSSLLEWFKTQVPAPVFALFHHVTIARAQQRLTALKDRTKTIGMRDVSAALAALQDAAVDTAGEARMELTDAVRKLHDERATLFSELNKFLKDKKDKNNKNKTANAIKDFDAYYRKKSQGTKLTTMQKEKITRADPLAPLTSDLEKPGFFSKKLLRYEARERKAVIAKRINGHDILINTATDCLQMR